MPARDAGVVDGEAGGEVVGAVEHQVVAVDQLVGVAGVDRDRVGLDLDVGVEVGQPMGGRVHLGPAHVGGGVDHLALQVGEGDHVGIDQADHADARRGQVERRRRAQAAGADDQHPRGLQLLLARPADLAQHQVAGVALDLFVGEIHTATIGECGDPATAFATVRLDGGLRA